MTSQPHGDQWYPGKAGQQKVCPGDFPLLTLKNIHDIFLFSGISKCRVTKQAEFEHFELQEIGIRIATYWIHFNPAAHRTIWMLGNTQKRRFTLVSHACRPMNSCTSSILATNVPNNHWDCPSTMEI